MVDVAVLKTNPDLIIPSYAHKGDAGMDIHSAVDTILKKRETKAIPTGIKIAIPDGYVGLVWDKSGHASKSIHTMAGVIDAGYRGEIKIVMKNLGNKDFEITKNMKIAQILIQPVARANILKQDNLDNTSRGESGFGSTGVL